MEESFPSRSESNNGMKIMQIQNYKEAPQGARYLATFDVVLDKAFLTLRNFKVLKSSKGGWFAVPPSFKIDEDEQGQPVWASIVEIHEKRREEFKRSLHEALEPLVRD